MLAAFIDIITKMEEKMAELMATIEQARDYMRKGCWLAAQQAYSAAAESAKGLNGAAQEMIAVEVMPHLELLRARHRDSDSFSEAYQTYLNTGACGSDLSAAHVDAVAKQRVLAVSTSRLESAVML